MISFDWKGTLILVAGFVILLWAAYYLGRCTTRPKTGELEWDPRIGGGPMVSEAARMRFPPDAAGGAGTMRPGPAYRGGSGPLPQMQSGRQHEAEIPRDYPPQRGPPSAQRAPAPPPVEYDDDFAPL